MNKTCKNCQQSFEITTDDQVFYAKIGVQDPRMCPQCRAQRRLAFRNERSFYKRPCDKCKKDVVSMYSPNKPYAVWCYECWFADDWDPVDYGQEYDPSRPFFEQFGELWNKVPKINLIGLRNVDSSYLNISADNKNCYMLIESSNNEDCINCYWIQVTKDCADCSFTHKCELCYEVDDGYDSYKVLYSKGVDACRESYFLFDCRNCSNCIGCSNLRNKQYCIFNEQVTKEQYEQFLNEAKLDTYEGVENLRGRFEEFKAKQPHRYSEITNAPGSTGCYIYNAKNCTSCFHTYEAEDCRYAVHAWREAKECVDSDTTGRGAEMIYNSTNTGLKGSNCICCSLCWGDSFLTYCTYCYDCQDCFGSTGLRKKQYCILNKQYTKEEYEKLKAQIIEDMKREGVYGEFFPQSLSIFGYNESCVQEQFPSTKEQAVTQGFKWEDTERGTYGKENGKDIFACTQCKKNFRIIPREFEFYQRLSIPLPRLCPECRHLRRFTARGPNRLWKRNCAKCNAEFDTNYPPDRLEIVYCESCYNAEII